MKAQLVRMLMQGRLARHRADDHPARGPGLRARPGASLRDQPGRLRPALPLPARLDAGLSAYAAPLGPLEAGADTFAGQIPTILKVNSSNSLLPASEPKTQAITASVDDALRLGCAAIGFTIYPGSSLSLEMFEDIAEMRREAAAKGVATVIWSYPRGEDLDKKAETAIDVTAYAAHIAALLGAHIIKVKLSTDHLSAARGQEGLRGRRRSTSRPAPRACATWSSPASAGGGSWSSRAAPPRARIR